MAKATVTELEVLFTANTDQVETAAKKVKDQSEKIEKKPVEQKIDGDAKGALDAMGRVEAEGKKIVSAKTMATVDANIERAETSLSKVQERLDYLHSIETEMEVTADIKKAESAIKQIARRRDGLVAAKESMVIDADTSPAESALGDLADEAGEAGVEGGEKAGGGLADGIKGALKAIPVAGGIVLAGVAIGKAVMDGIQDGLNAEVTRDRLQALTGLDAAEAGVIARAAGEAYASTFGESVEANMSTARLALQFDLIDDDATTRQAQHVIESLAGISDVLDEDVRPVAAAVTTMLASGLVKSADEAFDLIATGAREGVNRNEDLLDTLTEYPALFSRLGLSGEEALGLISQGMEAGARNSDLAADALKEFQIRATDASESSAQGFEALGLNAQEMTEKIAAGGESAREGLAQVLDGLREMEDPVARNAAAVALFGTQAEDLGEALFAMDLSSAVEELDGVTGAAQTMFETLKDNDATKMEEAKRNIEVAADGMKAALAAAFSEPLGEFADWVSANRGPIMEFLSALANGALDFGEGVVEAVASGTEAFGGFVAGPLASAVAAFADFTAEISGLPGIDLGDTPDRLREMAEGMRGFDDTTSEAADGIREALIPGIEDARDRFNDFMDPQIDTAYLHDATMRLAAAIDEVGYSADGSKISLDDLDASNLGVTASGRALSRQIQEAKSALDAEVRAGIRAGETQESLTEQYGRGREALIRQLEAMGLTEKQAKDLADTYGAVPETVETIFDAETSGAQDDVDEFVNDNTGRRIPILIDATPGRKVYSTDPGNPFVMAFEAQGGLLEFMRHGGLRPMQPVAQTVPPNTWRVVGDRSDVAEAYIPLDGSARSMSILLETMRRFGMLPMAEGGVVSSQQARQVTPTRTAPLVSMRDVYTADPQQFVRDMENSVRYQLMGR